MRFRRVLLTILVALTIVILSGCISGGLGEPSIVGTWGLMGFQVYQFTADGHLTVGDPSEIQTHYLYSADADSGEFWFEADPTDITPFTYTVTSSTLVITLDGMVTLTLSRM